MFLYLVFYMGNKSSSETSQSIVNQITSEAVFSSMTTVETKCNNTAQINQTMNLKCGISEEEETERMKIPGYFDYKEKGKELRAANYQACLAAVNEGQSFKRASGTSYDSVDDCEDINFECIISGVSQDALMSFKASCEVDAAMTADIQNSIKTELDNAAKQSQTDDAFGEVMEDISSAMNVGGSSSDKTSTEVINEVTTKISNEINTEFIQEMVGSFSVNQNLSLEGSDGSKITAISQEASMDIISDMVSKLESVAAVANEAETVATTVSEQTQETKGVADMFANLTGMLEGIMSGPFIIVLIVFIIGVVVFSIVGGGGGRNRGGGGVDAVMGAVGGSGGASAMGAAMGGSGGASALKTAGMAAMTSRKFRR